LCLEKPERSGIPVTLHAGPCVVCVVRVHVCSYLLAAYLTVSVRPLGGGVFCDLDFWGHGLGLDGTLPRVRRGTDMPV